MATLDEKGREILDGTPMQPPVGYKRQPSLAEQIREMVRSERLAQELAAAGHETFEEADDFDVDDEYDPSSPWEQHFDPTPISELRSRLAAAEAAEAAAKEVKTDPPAPSPEPKQNKSNEAD